MSKEDVDAVNHHR